LFDILLVEDSISEAELTRRALQKCEFKVRVTHAHDGLEAVEYLKETIEAKQQPMPDLILLDLKMPRLNGFDFLKQLRSDHSLKHLLVIVLTTSGRDEDILACYQEGANAYLVKPVELQQFYEMIQAMGRFYYSVAKRPPQVNGG